MMQFWILGNIEAALDFGLAEGPKTFHMVLSI